MPACKMPTEIRVVLPNPGTDDLLSIADAFSESEDNVSVNGDSFQNDNPAINDTRPSPDRLDNNTDTTDSKLRENNVKYVENVTENKTDEGAVNHKVKTTVDQLTHETARVDNSHTNGFFKNVNVNLTAIKPPPSPREQHVPQYSHVSSTASITEAKGFGSNLEKDNTSPKRVMSAKIEHLISQSNRKALVTSVRNDVRVHQSNRESTVTCARNTTQRPRSSSSQYHPRRNPAMKQSLQQKQNKKREDLPKVEDKSSQTGEEEGSGGHGTGQNEEQPERLTEDAGKTTSRTALPRRQIRPSSSPARLRQRPVSPKPRTVNNVRLSITGTYDIEVEHRDIMMKALNSYHQHRRRDNTPQTTHYHRESDENAHGNIMTINEIGTVDDRLRRKNLPRHSLFRNSSLLRDILASVGDGDGEEPTDRESERKESSCSSTLSTPRSAASTVNNNNNNNNNRIQLIYDDDKLVSRIWTDERKRETLENSRRISRRNPNSAGSRGGSGKDRNHVQPKSRPTSSVSSFDSDKTFTLARCRLIYNDQPPKRTRTTRPRSSYERSNNTNTNNNINNNNNNNNNHVIQGVTSGVLVDSVGHVYGRSKPRPLSALPCKFHVYLQERSRNHYNGGPDGWYSDRRHFP